MCLDTVTKTYQPNDRMVVGYKVYKKYGKKYRDYFKDNIRKEGEHYIAKGPSMLYIRDYYDVNNYDCGFHIFTTLKSAKHFLNKCMYRNSIICEVLAWNIRAEGYDYERKCIIAKNIRIMREIKL